MTKRTPSVCEMTLAAFAGFPATDGKTGFTKPVSLTQDNSHGYLDLSNGNFVA